MTVLYCYYDQIGSEFPIVHLAEYPILRETQCCYVIRWAGNLRGVKYVGKDARKSFAYPTIELARNSYEIRKRRQLQYAAQRYDFTKMICDKIAKGDWNFTWDMEELTFPPSP